MLKSSGRRIDLSAPFVDAMLPDGNRLHVVLEGISRGFSAVNIRNLFLRATVSRAPSSSAVSPRRPPVASVSVDISRLAARGLLTPRELGRQQGPNPRECGFEPCSSFGPHRSQWRVVTWLYAMALVGSAGPEPEGGEGSGPACFRPHTESQRRVIVCM